MIRNQAGQRIWLKAFNASGYVEDDQAKITCDLHIDGAVGVALGNPTQATGKGGNYYYEPSKAQTDGHELKPIVKSATPGVQVVATPDVIYTTETTVEQIVAGVIAAISSSGSYPILWPLTDTESETRELDRRDDYTDAAPILIDVATAHDLEAEGVTIAFEATKSSSTITGTGTVATVIDAEEGQYRIAVGITNAQTDSTLGTYTWKLIAILANGDRHTIRRGCFKLV